MTRTLRPCGTPAAYRRHLRHGEVPCQECLDAEAARRRPEGSVPRQPAVHGSNAMYRRGCRCELCGGAHSRERAAWRLAVAGLAALVPEMVPHGRGGYGNYGCRCAVCTDANSAACREYRRRRREKAGVG